MPGGRPRSDATIKQMTYRESRRRAAIEMLRGGAELSTIAIQLDYPSEKACQMDIDRTLLKVAKMPFEEAKAVTVLQLEGLLLAHWPAARNGDFQATDRVLKILEAKAKLLGLNAPTRSEVVTMDAVEAEIKRLESQMEPKSE